MNCLICLETTDEPTNYTCPNNECNVFICNHCIYIWDQFHSIPSCPICHTSRVEHDIENQTRQTELAEEPIQPERVPRRWSRYNRVHPSNNIIDNYIDDYCEYIFDRSKHICLKILNTIFYVILCNIILMIIGFLTINFLYYTEYGSTQKVIEQTKEKYGRPDFYLTMILNGLCFLIFAWFLFGCCLSCSKKCRE